jgi:N-acetylglucosaminyldiphosphoundecaprenol N-acetyl-beta-D-mannosaminyltransferase
MSATRFAAPERITIGGVGIDVLTLQTAIDAIEGLIASGRGGTVFTPNVDHIVQCSEDPRFRQAYERASLSLVDGMAVLWAARLLGRPLPEKISGSDLVVPLMRRAADRGWRVYFVGGADGVGAKARDRLLEEMPSLQVVGVSSPMISVDQPAEAWAPIVAAIRETKPDLILVAFGAPKQEIWSTAIRDELAPAVLVGVGASLDFVAGIVERAPKWISDSGLEWLHRLGKEPRRLWRRYLLRDPKFAAIFLRDLMRAREARRR